MAILTTNKSSNKSNNNNSRNGLNNGYSVSQWGSWTSWSLLIQKCWEEVGETNSSEFRKSFFKGDSTFNRFSQVIDDISKVLLGPSIEIPLESKRCLFRVFDRSQNLNSESRLSLSDVDFFGGLLSITQWQIEEFHADDSICQDNPLLYKLIMALKSRSEIRTYELNTVEEHPRRLATSQLSLQGIFLQYDRDRDGVLSSIELLCLLTDCFGSRPSSVSNQVDELKSQVIDESVGKVFGFAAFEKAVVLGLLPNVFKLAAIQHFLPKSVKNKIQLFETNNGNTNQTNQNYPLSSQNLSNELSPRQPIIPVSDTMTPPLVKTPSSRVDDVFVSPTNISPEKSNIRRHGVKHVKPSITGNRHKKMLPTASPFSYNSNTPQQSSLDDTSSSCMNKLKKHLVFTNERTQRRLTDFHNNLDDPLKNTEGNDESSQRLKNRNKTESLLSRVNYRGVHVQPHDLSEVVQIAKTIVQKLMDMANDDHPKNWTNLLINERLVNFNDFIKICDSVVCYFEAENSVVSVDFPCRVYGDIHGQLGDLVLFFQNFSWPYTRKGDIFSMNYIFLGDIVDRGRFSVESVLLIFCLKILFPSKIYIIRGNHEDRLMNCNFGFKDECELKYGMEEGGQLWSIINDVFCFLPLAGVVGNSVFCIHGGIGTSIQNVGDLVDIEKPISVPVKTEDSGPIIDRVILDALWSDPTDSDEVVGVCNSPRGPYTCRFGPDVVENFLFQSGLDLIIRAHECVRSGFEYFADGKLITVFSATNYCNVYKNDGAVIVLTQDPETGEVFEHPQVIKNNDKLLTDSIEHNVVNPWNSVQYRPPSPMRERPQS